MLWTLLTTLTLVAGPRPAGDVRPAATSPTGRSTKPHCEAGLRTVSVPVLAMTPLKVPVLVRMHGGHRGGNDDHSLPRRRHHFHRGASRRFRVVKGPPRRITVAGGPVPPPSFGKGFGKGRKLPAAPFRRCRAWPAVASAATAPSLAVIGASRPELRIVKGTGDLAIQNEGALQALTQVVSTRLHSLVASRWVAKAPPKASDIDALLVDLDLVHEVLEQSGQGSSAQRLKGQMLALRMATTSADWQAASRLLALRLQPMLKDLSELS